MIRRAVALGSLGALVACAEPDTSLVYDSGVIIADADLTPLPDATENMPRTPTWLDDIEPIVRASCNSCHGNPTVAGAPMPLVTYADVTASYHSSRSDTTRPVYVFMATSVADPLMPMPQGQRFSAAIIDLFQRWADAGAPMGEPPPPPDGGIPDRGVRDAGPRDMGVRYPDAEPAPDAPPDSGIIDPFMGMGAVETVQTGFGFLEGPVWLADQGVLVFSDVDNNRMYQLRPPNAITPYRDPSQGANGNALDPRGRVVTCRHRGRDLVRTSSTSTTGLETVAARYMNGRFNSPNDIAVRSDGVIYFSDPTYGLRGGVEELGVNGLFRATPRDGTFEVTLEYPVGPPGQPNGLVIMPGEQILVMTNTPGNHVSQFDIQADGSLTGARTWFYTSPAPDGLAIDAGNNIYVATTAGIEVFEINPPNMRRGTIAIPTPSNMAWGDNDRRSLYVTAGPTLYRVRIPVPGAAD